MTLEWLFPLQQAYSQIIRFEISVIQQPYIIMTVLRIIFEKNWAKENYGMS